ncbi:MAG TPA: DUF262 domain-containing protein [Terriglobales bacterium]|nr:DUF262 domain-containing protein [Terriglobales bacterium]
MSIADIAPSAVKIDKLLHRMEEGEIKVPAFQRGFVWKQAQVIDLLDSIYNDFPIGSILLWNSHERLKSSNIGGFAIPEREPSYPVNYVLDGQQRLSALYGVFCKNRQLTTDEKYKVDPAIFELYFDIDEDKFVAEAERIAFGSYLKMSCLFSTKDFLNAVQSLDSERMGRAERLLSKFSNYEVPVIVTSKRNKGDVGTIFERINNTGTKLTTFDLMIAWTWSEDFHLREKIDEILDILDQKGYGETDEKIVLQCLSSIVKQTVRTKDILSLEPDEVKANIDKLQDALEKTVDFLATELKVLSGDFLPQSHQIIPIAYFFSQVNTPTADQCDVVRKWFWRTSFSLRYAGATDLRLNQDIALFHRLAKYKIERLDEFELPLTEKTLIQTPFARTNVYTRSFLLLLGQLQPRNLVNGVAIDVDVALSKYNSKEYHHIFPRAFLKERGIPDTKIGSICNFCYLPSDSNKKISKRAPSDYIFNIVPSGQRHLILQSNLMPIDLDIYLKDDYDAFLSKRASLALEHLTAMV